MAKTTPKNPKYFAGPLPEKDENILATDGETWKAGTPFVSDAAGTVSAAVTATTTGIKGFFAEDQLVATSSSRVKTFRVRSAKTQFVGYVSNADADVVAAQTDKFGTFRMHIGTTGDTDNVMSVDTANTTNPLLAVDELFSDREDGDADITDNPGRVIYHYTQAVLDA